MSNLFQEEVEKFMNLLLKVKYKRKKMPLLKLKIYHLMMLNKKELIKKYNLKCIQVHLIKLLFLKNLNLMKEKRKLLDNKDQNKWLKKFKKKKNLNYKINLKQILYLYPCLFLLIIQIGFHLLEYKMPILQVFIKGMFKNLWKENKLQKNVYKLKKSQKLLRLKKFQLNVQWKY